MTYRSGSAISGQGTPRSRGSVISPSSAHAAAVSGLTRYTCALFVPLRPSKLRFEVRTLTASVWGAWAAPMQNPQAASSSRAPAASRSNTASVRAIVSSTCRDPGATTRLTSGRACRPFSIAATVMRSRQLEFVHEPMHTWWTRRPASSRTVLIWSGEWGQAAIGSTVARSSSIVRS